jgi:SAM-dependent methyltransferase
MIDRLDNAPDVLRDDLANLRTINRCFGGLSAVGSQINRLYNKIPADKTIEILDLATGSGDHPVALAGSAQKLARRIRITAVDKNPDILAIARENARGFANIKFVEQDILALPYPDGEFDIVLCSLALHHLSRRNAILLLQAMHRLSKVGFIVNDLNRSHLGVWTAWLYANVTTRNPMTRHDSCLSVLRGFTPHELNTMAGEAGLRNVTIKKRPFFRLILIGEHHAR